MTMRSLFLVLALAAVWPAQGGWQRAAPDFSWDFPRDHWAHPDYKTEWWYQTGHLQSVTEPSQRFGYQFTFFRVGILPDRPDVESSWASNSAIMGHASIVDVTTGDHVFTEILYRTTALLGGFNPPGDTLVAWSRGPGGTDRQWTLVWNGSAFDVSMSNRWAGVGFTLTSTPAKPRIFQGPNGFSAKTDDGQSASLYYSFTRLDTQGTLTMGGQEYQVTGSSWMDKEFGSDQLDRRQTGWDWFSLQLDDGREIMLYILRAGAEVDYAHATVVDPAGRTAYPASSQWTVTPTGNWTSGETGARYPSGWQVAVDGRTLTIQPVVPDQENVSALVPGLYYWEGAVDVLENGAPAGRGYVELTGYGSSQLPALSGN